jgi:copper transport protein
VVTVRFDDIVRVGSGNAAVANAGGGSVQAGPARAQGRVLTIPLRDHLRRGDYSVRWSIVSDDGHLERGVLAFSVGTGVAPGNAVLTAKTPLGWWAVVARIAFYFGLLTAAGLAVFGLRARDLPGLQRPLAHALFFSLLLAFLGVSGVVQEAASGTRNAHVLDVALAVSLVGAAAAALAPRVAWLLPVAGGCALALLAAPTFSGHALDPSQPRWLSIPADLAHTTAAAVWLGGLVALLTLVPRLATRAEATRRVSQAAFAAVPLLAAAGVLRAVTELSGVDQLWTTSYGRALLIKSALFVPALALGWLNRARLLEATRALRRSVRGELVLLAAIVGVVAVLVQLRPGRDAATAVAAPPVAAQPPVLPPKGAVVDAAEAGALAVGVARSPLATTVTLLGPDGTGVNGQVVLVDGARALACGAGCYRGPARPGPLRVTVNGRPLTFAVSRSAPAAAALLARATRAYVGARTIVFDESLRSGPTGGIETRFTVKAPHGLAYRIRGGPDAIVIGAQRWDRTTATAPWVQSQQTPLQVTQTYWRHPTNAHLVAPRTLTFLDRSLPAWFRLTLDRRGRPLRLRMTAAAHFMTEHYLRYDAPVTLSPPPSR